MAEDFDPRRAALTHAALAESQAANAIACGLVYVGDQIARQSALLGIEIGKMEAAEMARALNRTLGSRDVANRGEGFHTAGGEE